MKYFFTLSLPGAVHFLMLSLLVTPNLVAQTNVSGNVQGTWTKASSPYKIIGNLTIPIGQTLTINPGVEVQFASGASQVNIQGTLKAEGTVTDSIKFTGLALGFQDNTGPVTVGIASANSSFRFVKISTLGYYYNTDNTAALIIKSSSCTVQNCSFLGIKGTGIQLDIIGPVVSNNIFSTLNMDIILTVDNLTALSGNGALKVGLLSGMTANATLAPGYLYYKIMGNLTVPGARTLTINPGVELRFASGVSRLTVQGTLTAEGTVTDSIKFTGLALGFQDNTGPVIVEATSTNTSLKYIKISSLGYYYNDDNTAAIIIRSSSSIIQNCSLQSIKGTGIHFDNAAPLIRNNFFSTTNMDVILTVDNLGRLVENGALKIGLLPGMLADASLTTTNLYYKLLGNFTVPSAKTLSIGPGVELMFTSGLSRVTVQGTLKAEGTVTDSIKFTGLATGFQENAGPIIVEASSTNTSLKYVRINALGYYYNADNTAAIIIRSSSCTVQNCRLQNIKGTGIQFDNAAPLISNSFFATTNMDAILTVDNLPRLVGNGALKIGLLPGMVADAVLAGGNIYYKLMGNLTVPAAKTLTITKGVELLFASGLSQVTVQGTLKAEGTASDSIKFTGLALGFQDNTGPVIVEATSVNSSLRYVTVSALAYYYNTDITAAIIVRSSSCSIQNCRMLNTRGTALQIGNATPLVANNLFFATANMDAIVDLDKIRILSGNGPLKIGLTAIAAMTTNDTLTNAHLFYRLLANQTIPVNKILTISPGVELQFSNNTSQLIVQGSLEAKGVPNNYITFKGGVPGFQDQRGPVVIETTSVNTNLQFVNIDSLGYYYNTSTTAILVIKSSSSTLTNCIFQNNRGVALSVQNASAVITRGCFYNNVNGAVLSSGGAAKFIQCNFVANTAFGINNTSTAAADIIDAGNCWWGNVSGPKQLTTNPSGFGDLVSNKVLYNPWSNSSYDCAGLDLVLPVALIDFSVAQISNDVNCHWRTISEINSSYFTIQRSNNGVAFLDLGNIPASGNSLAQLSYQFMDTSPFNGINYYRLKMVDRDGRFSYSKVAEINISRQTAFTIYPNPVRENIFIQVQKKKSEKIALEITDMQGKVLQHIDRQLPAGFTTVSLNVSRLSRGTYILVLKGDKLDRKIFMKE